MGRKGDPTTSYRNANKRSSPPLSKQPIEGYVGGKSGKLSIPDETDLAR